jgi:predicted alpha-1,2-mannosidase
MRFMKHSGEILISGNKRYCIIIVLALILFQACSTAEKPVDLVYPHLDAAHSRWFYFSSSSRPFGMINLFPDTKIGGEWESGYRYNVDTIRCFSHIHEWQLAGIAVMPVVFTPENTVAVMKSFESPFSHDREEVKPGYHAVTLDRYNIRAELTASSRVGFHRYQFQPGAQGGIIFNLGGRLGPSDMITGGFEKLNNFVIRGFVVNGPTNRRNKECPVYFNAVFNKPIRQIHLLDGDTIRKNTTRWQGKNAKVLVEFDQPGTVLMKVGASFVDTDGATRNIAMEIPHWNFNQVVSEAQHEWNTMLSRITVEGGTLQQRRRFYTDLWHAIQGRRTISDYDGRYADLTGATRMIRQLPLNEQARPRFNMYNSDAFWGAQWTLNTLWALVYPEITEEFCNSFITYYQNGGLIPRGPSGGNYTFVMTGATSTPFFVSAWQKGIRGFDIETAYKGLRKNHLPGGMMSKAGYEHHTAKGGGIEAYMNLGYVPYPLADKEYGYHQDGAGMTMEYAYQDWTLAQLAKALGKNDDYMYFLKRSENFRNLYNPATGYIQPKDSSGRWQKPFDPLLYDHGYVEGNAAQFTWFVPHDLPTLFHLMGGSDSAVIRLDRQFAHAAAHRFCNEHPERHPKFINEKRTWINYSNQPNAHAAFIFNYAGAPWLTQYWSREVIDKAFSGLSPITGYNGDEDQGLMGSLSVLMKMGIFQMTGGCEENPVYEIGSPVFDAITIQLHPSYYKGKFFRIKTINNSSKNRYIESVTWNSQPHSGFTLRHREIVSGGELVLQMTDEPRKNILTVQRSLLYE